MMEIRNKAVAIAIKNNALGSGKRPLVATQVAATEPVANVVRCLKKSNLNFSASIENGGFSSSSMGKDV